MRAVPAQCDVAIVGGGYTGLSAALTLARAGRNVHLFERQRPGEGASTRNAGIASALLARGLTDLTASHGEELARSAFVETQEAWAALAVFIQDEGVPCEFEVGGALFGAFWPRQLDHMAREAEFCQTQLGIDARTIVGPQIHAEIGSDRYIGGLIRPDVATLNPARLHLAMLALAMDAGVQIHGETGVTRLHHSKDGEHELQTLRGRIRARQVFVATNGYADRSDRWLQRRIVPVRTGVITTQALPADFLQELLPSIRTVIERRRLAHFLRLSSDRQRLLFGGLAPLAARNDAAVLALLRAELEQIFPQLREVQMSHAWSGFCGYNSQRLPQLYNRRGVRYALGFSGTGLVLSHWLGQKAAWQILGDERGRTIFDSDPPGAIPMYAGKTWFLPAVVRYLRVRDRLDQRGRNSEAVISEDEP
jgi:glycine/D-amino acid oxidase-like deaminating enzyme